MVPSTRLRLLLLLLTHQCWQSRALLVMSTLQVPLSTHWPHTPPPAQQMHVDSCTQQHAWACMQQQPVEM
jgi:hypothetical protein